MSQGSLREGDLESCEPDDNSMECFCPTEMGNNEKLVDEHSEENAVALGEVTIAKTIEVGDSTRGNGLFPRFIPISSSPITSFVAY